MKPMSLSNANDQLRRLRQQLGISPNYSQQQSAQPDRQSWDMVNASALLASLRTTNPDKLSGKEAGSAEGFNLLTLRGDPPGVVLDKLVDDTRSDPSEQEEPPQSIRHYPTIGAAAIGAQQVPLYRLWLACRWLDQAGRGWVSLDDIKVDLTAGGRLPLCSWRHIRRLVSHGEGLYWTAAGDGLYLFGAAKVAANVVGGRLQGAAVALPLSVLASIGEFRAHLYAAVHSGRREANPITRGRQRELYGVPERTQRHYCQVAGIERRRNIAIGGKLDEVSRQEAASERGRAWFAFRDHNGRNGQPGGEYNAWQLPSTHIGPHECLPVGRKRKINAKIGDLVNNGTQGNDNRRIERVFYQRAAEAAKRYNRDQSNDLYWPRSSASQATFTIWSCLPKWPPN